MKKLVILLIFLASASFSTAQTGCYATIKQEGLDSLKKKEYLAAMEKFELAYDCYDCPVNNDLRKWQEECRKGIETLIEELNSDRDEKIRGLLLNQLNLGMKDIQLGNFYAATDALKTTYELATINDTIRMISSLMLKGWYSSLTLPWLRKDFHTYNAQESYLYPEEYGLDDSVYYTYDELEYVQNNFGLPVQTPVFKNEIMPLLIPPYKIIKLSEDGDVITDSIKPGLSGENIIFNRYASLVIEVLGRDTVAIHRDIGTLPVVDKIKVSDMVQQVYSDNKGKYLAVSYVNNPEIEIFSLAEKSVKAVYKPRKSVTRKKRKKFRHEENTYQQNLNMLYGQDMYNQEYYDYEKEAARKVILPFMVIKEKLFCLYPDGYIETFNIQTGKKKQLDYEFEIRKMDCSPDEQFMILYGDEGVMLYGALTGIHYPIPSFGIMPGLCRFTRDNKYIAVATINNYIDLYSIEDGYPVFVSSNMFPGYLNDFNFNREGDKIVVLANNAISVHAVPLWTKLSGSINSNMSDYIYNVGIEGDFVYGLTEYYCKFWKLPRMSPSREDLTDKYEVELIGSKLGARSMEENVRAVKSLGEVINNARKTGSVYKTGLSADAGYIAVAGLGRDFYVYRAATGELARTFNTEGYAVSFSFFPDHRIAVTCDNGKLYIFGLQQNEPLKILDHNGLKIVDCKVSQGGSFFCVVLEDATMVIYFANSYREHFRIPARSDYSGYATGMPEGWFSPNDRYIAMSGPGNMIGRWDLQDGTKVDSIQSYAPLKTVYWENDSIFFAGDEYGIIYRIDSIGRLNNPGSIYAEYIPTLITGVPGTSMIIVSSSTGYLSFYDKLFGYRLGLPFIFESLPEVLSYDTLSDECLVYVKGDGFYRLQPFIGSISEIEEIESICFTGWGDYIFDTINVLSDYNLGRSVEKIKLKKAETGVPAWFPDLAGDWDCTSTNSGGMKTSLMIHIGSRQDSIYTGYFEWVYTDPYDTTYVDRYTEITEGRYDPATRKISFRFPGEYSYYPNAVYKAYVSYDDKALIHGTINYNESGTAQYAGIYAESAASEETWSGVKTSESHGEHTMQQEVGRTRR